MTTPFSPTSLVLAASLLALLPACEAGARTVGEPAIDSVEPGVEDVLTRSGPCDLHRLRTASDPAGSVALYVMLGRVEDGDELSPTHDVADPDVVVWLSRGSHLFSDVCNRIGDWGEPEIEEAWEAPHDASQLGTIEIDPDPGAALDSLEFATVTLHDVTLRRQDQPGEPDIVIDELVMPR